MRDVAKTEFGGKTQAGNSRPKQEAAAMIDGIVQNHFSVLIVQENVMLEVAAIVDRSIPAQRQADAP
ncbi:hypothetical protein GCM10027093_07070 [Paraburkholderia jirisanensis]